MPKEKEDYRLILEGLLERFPGREAITIPQAAKILGVKPESYRADDTMPKFTVGQRQVVSLRALARRMTS